MDSVHQLLRKYHIQPKKSLGQNFLADEFFLKKIVNAVGLNPGDAVLEIGPGLGNLTRFLLEAEARVTAVEIDRRMVEILHAEFASEARLNIIHGDILKIPPDEFSLKSGYQVVANIPYYITSAIIRRLLEAHHQPSGLWLTIQTEVADRICAVPGEMSLLSLSVQVYGQPSKVFSIPAGAFYPPPQVDSSLLQIALYPQPVIPADQLTGFFQLAKAGFSQKRKTLRNSLAGGLGCEKETAEMLLVQAGISPQERAENLTLQNWSNLTEAFLNQSRRI